jgi:hypothetical protein
VTRSWEGREQKEKLKDEEIEDRQDKGRRGGVEEVARRGGA